MEHWRRIARRCAHAEDPFDAFTRSLCAMSTSRTVNEVKTAKQRVGKAWEEFCQAVLQLLGYEEVYLLADAPEALLSGLGLRRRDMGIDMIAGSHGEWSAVQCKFRARGPITWQQISTFAALCARSGPWKSHLVMTNAPRVRREGWDVKDATMGQRTFRQLPRHEWLALGGEDAAGHVCGGNECVALKEGRDAFLTRLEASGSSAPNVLSPA